MQQTARANAKGRAAVSRLTDVLSFQAKMEANKQTFGKFLGLGFPSDTQSVSVQSKNEQESLVFRYKLPNDRLKYLQDEDTVLRKGPSLSTYAAILDELTTQSLIAGAKKHLRPGVSVTLQCQWGAQKARTPEEVDIVTTVTKQGRTLGFVRAEVRDPSTNGMICHFDHVKYLPTGWALGLLLTPFGMWCMNFVLKHVAPLFQKKTPPLPNYQGILDSFEFTSDKSASFSYGPHHANGVGGLHGGVQAILMEKLGRKVAKTEFGGNVGVECQGLQVSYQSSASKKLELRAHVIDLPQEDRLTLRIEILRASKKKRTVVSEGILTFQALSKKDQ